MNEKETLHEVTLECENELGEKLTLPIIVGLSPSGVVMIVPGYETHLSAVFEYNEGVLQIVAWGEESIGNASCHEYVLSTNVPATMKKIDEYFGEDKEEDDEG